MLGFLTVATLVAGSAQAAPPAVPAGPPDKVIANLAAAYKADTPVTVAIHVVRLADGATVAEVQPTKLMLPASNEKILTSAVALKRLGENFKFQTVLAMVGDDLVVVGDGDPTTGDPRLAAEKKENVYSCFDRWAAALKQAGVSQVNNIVIRCGIFAGPATHPDWPAKQAQRWYSAAVSGVNFNDNCFDISFAVKDGKLTTYLEPVTSFFAVENKVTVGAKNVWGCRFDPAGNKMLVQGTVPAAGCDVQEVSVPAPAMFYGTVLADRLTKAGVAVRGSISPSNDPAWSALPANKKVIAVETTPIISAMNRANKQSLNMMAECLFLRSGVENGQPSSWSKAAEVANAVLAREYGLDPATFAVSDGSGFSRGNHIAPATMTQLLRQLTTNRTFVSSLAMSGEDGSLAKRLGDVNGRILAKTGSLAGASALSGYVVDKSGKLSLAFSIMVNGRTGGKAFTGKKFQDQVCEILIKSVDAAVTTAEKPANSPPTLQIKS